ncbi:MAG: hypothetical protein WBN06_03475, partial [Lysobacterales bacterium]
SVIDLRHHQMSHGGVDCNGAVGRFVRFGVPGHNKSMHFRADGKPIVLIFLIPLIQWTGA